VPATGTHGPGLESACGWESGSLRAFDPFAGSLDESEQGKVRYIVPERFTEYLDLLGEVPQPTEQVVRDTSSTRLSRPPNRELKRLVDGLLREKAAGPLLATRCVVPFLIEG
jgi:hypothetical protein